MPWISNCWFLKSVSPHFPLTLKSVDFPRLLSLYPWMCLHYCLKEWHMSSKCCTWCCLPKHIRHLLICVSMLPTASFCTQVFGTDVQLLHSHRFFLQQLYSMNSFLFISKLPSHFKMGILMCFLLCTILKMSNLCRLQGLRVDVINDFFSILVVCEATPRLRNASQEGEASVWAPNWILSAWWHI